MIWTIYIMKGPVNVCSNPSIFGNIFLVIKKAVNIFSIFEKFFCKNKNYCVPLGNTLAKSYFFFER